MRRWTGRLAVAAIFILADAPAIAQVGDWSGFYIGGEIGAARSRQAAAGVDDHTQLSNIVVPGRGLVVVPGTSVGYTQRGQKTSLLYGGLVGAQLQTGSLILGLEGDVHGPRDLADSATGATLPATILAPNSSATITRSTRTSYDWSLRVRVGTGFGRSMIYATGGIAGARVRLLGEDSFTTPAGPASTSGNIAAFNSPAIGPVVIAAGSRASMTGWTAGLGGEHRLSRVFGFGLEARYTDFGSRDFALADGCSPATVAGGQCGNAARSSPPIVVNGNTLNPATDVTPGTVPGQTRVSLSEWRLSARLIFRF